MPRMRWMRCAAVVTWLTVLAVTFTAHGGSDDSPPMPQPANLLANPTGQRLDKAGQPAHWSVTSAKGDFTFTAPPSQGPDGQPALRLTNQAGTGARHPRVYQTLRLHAGQAYHIHLQARTTTGSAVVSLNPSGSLWFGRAPQRSGVIATQGQWQTVEWLFTPQQEGEHHLILTLLTPNQEAADLWIANLRVTPLRPAGTQAGRARRHPGTPLARDGQPQALIVYPADHPVYRVMAQRLVSAVEARCGVTLPMITDRQATEQRHPVLLDAHRRTHLILLGRLGINRALWPVYNRFMTAVDGYYPGGDGHALHTASNFDGLGRNAIIVGGSTDRGAGMAIAALEKAIAQADAQPGSMTLPWLHDIALGGDCLAAFDRDEAARSRQGLVSGMDHGARPHRQFYENMMAYYWSGRRSYLDRALAVLQDIHRQTAGSDEGIVWGHYGLEFFIRAYDMVDDSGVLPDDLLQRTDDLIVRTMRHWQTSEARFRTLLKPPYEQVDLWDHACASWLADKTMCDFILNRLDTSPQVTFMAKQRQAHYIRGYDALLAQRWRGSLVGSNFTDVATMTLHRYALEMERYDLFFDSGQARLAALYHLARASNPQGDDIGLAFGLTSGVTEFKLFLGISASYHHDGQLAAILRTMPKHGRVHYGVMVNGVHAYTPGDELASAKPVDHLGASVLPINPALRDKLKSADARTPFRTLAQADHDRQFDLATLRHGYDRDDDYLLLAGSQELLPGSLIRMASQGHLWLKPSTLRQYHYQNALSVRRLSQWSHQDLYPPVARLVSQGNWQDISHVMVRMEDFAGADWQRLVVRLAPGVVLVRDEVTALHDDTYLIHGNWRPTGGALVDGDWVATQDSLKLVIRPVANTHVLADHDRDARFQVNHPLLRHRQRLAMTVGQQAVGGALLIVQDRQAPIAYEARPLGDSATLLRRAADGAIWLVGRLPADLGDTDAPLVVIQSRQLIAFGATHLTRQHQRHPATPGQPLVIQLDDADDLPAQLASRWQAARPVTRAPATPIDDTHAPLRPLTPRWTSDVAMSPAAITGARPIAPGVYDLGRPVALTEVRHHAGPLPATVELADTPNGPWRPMAGQRRDHPRPIMANYGQTLRQQVDGQSLTGPPQVARYVRLGGEAGHIQPADLSWHDGQALAAEHRQRVRLVRWQDGGPVQVVLHPDLWPDTRPQPARAHHVHVLDAQGKAQWRFDAPQRLLRVEALPWQAGHTHLLLASLDGHVRVVDAAGQVVSQMTTHGRPPVHASLDHPTPSAIGLWQRDAQGKANLVVGRYHFTTLFNPAGQLTQDLRTGSYWTSGVLPVGVDYTGDGIDDSAVLTQNRLHLITGQPNGQAHGSVTGVALPVTGPDLAGSPTLAFEVIAPWQRPGRVPLWLAKENMIGLYDLAGRRWLMSWQPTVHLGAALAQPAQRRVWAAGHDGLLWRMDLSDTLALGQVRSFDVGARVERLVPLGDRGDLLAASDRGLLRLSADGQAVTLTAEPLVDVALDTSAGLLVVVTAQGRALAYDATTLLR